MRHTLLLAAGLVVQTMSGLAQTPAPIDPFAEASKEAVPAEPKAVAPSGDAAKILEKLAAVQKEFEGKKKDIATAALGRYSSAAISEVAASQFYMTCLQMVQDRVPDLDGVSRQDVKDKQSRMKQTAERIEDTPGRAAMLQLQLQYLVFTMEAPAMKDRGALVSRVKDFMNKAVALVKIHAGPQAETPHKPASTVASKNKRESETQRDEKARERARREVLQVAKVGVMSSMFAQAYNLQNYFKPMDSWPDSPLNLEGAFTSMILPYRHENKPELLSNEWDEFIALQVALQRCEQDEQGYARWLINGYKSLLWRKWMDLLRYGKNRLTAADELVKLVKENPTHSSVGGWVGELSQVMTEIQNPQEAPPASTESAPPPN